MQMRIIFRKFNQLYKELHFFEGWKIKP